LSEASFSEEKSLIVYTEFNRGEHLDSEKPVSYRFSDTGKAKTPAEARV
jgi:hypothetical protein